MLLDSIVIPDIRVVRLICLYRAYCEDLILQHRVSLGHNRYNGGQTSVIYIVYIYMQSDENYEKIEIKRFNDNDMINLNSRTRLICDNKINYLYLLKKDPRAYFTHAHVYTYIHCKFLSNILLIKFFGVLKTKLEL